MLYDAGRGERAAELLGQLGVKRLDLAVMSHGDSDHIGGFEQVVPKFRPRVFLNNGLAATSQTYARVIGAFRAAGSQGLLASERTINLGAAVKLQVLPAPAGVPKDDQNSNSVGVLLTYGKFRAFFGGDAEPVTMQGWQRKYGAALKDLDVYKAAHHGSKNNDTASFVDFLSPGVVAIGVGKNNYGHPNPEALRLYQGAGAKVFRTDLDGTITVTVKANGAYSVTTERGSGAQGEARSTAPRAATPRPTIPAPAASPDSSSVSFRNCTEARAAGFMNIQRGQPGYAPKLDRDGDGVACKR